MSSWLLIFICILVIYGIWKSWLIYYVIYLINVLYDKYCNNTAILNPKDFKWTKRFRKNWRIIREEYESYKRYIPSHSELNNVTGSCDPQGKWKTLYLRAYNKDTDLIDLFPQTKKLINSIPCTLAYFSILKPGAKLEPHYGLYKGVLRYHLALDVPKEYSKCYLCIKDKDNKLQKIIWRQGKDVMFDDMYLHYVINETDEQRVVLFLDIKRDFDNWWLNFLNNICLKFINTSDELQNTINNINKCNSEGN